MRSSLTPKAAARSGPTERRLAAILAADVVGYSRLMGADEVGTLRALKKLRAELLEPLIDDHHGRVVKTAGDAVLAVFASAVDAVACAATIQRQIRRGVGGAAPLEMRIGVNVGDVIVDEDDIFGDGVNVAARLEAICEPGGVALSRATHEQVRDKLDIPFLDLGERTVKNIARPLRVFAIAPQVLASASSIEIVDRGEGASHLASAYPQAEVRTVRAGSKWLRLCALAAIILVAIWWHAEVSYAFDQIASWAMTSPAKPAARAASPAAPAISLASQKPRAKTPPSEARDPDMPGPGKRQPAASPEPAPAPTTERAPAAAPAEPPKGDTAPNPALAPLPPPVDVPLVPGGGDRTDSPIKLHPDDE